MAEAFAKVTPGRHLSDLSALQFHELTTQLPFQVWMAIPNKARKPKVDGLQIRFARFSGRAFDEGIGDTIEHIQVRIYNPAKTVADCFKYRNKIGLDVAIEALRDCCENGKPLGMKYLSDDQCDAALYGGNGVSPSGMARRRSVAAQRNT